MTVLTCPGCRAPRPDKGRAFDGRRAYRCRACRKTWTEGLHGRARRYSPQRLGDQFHDTGATRSCPVWSVPSIQALMGMLKG